MQICALLTIFQFFFTSVSLGSLYGTICKLDVLKSSFDINVLNLGATGGSSIAYLPFFCDILSSPISESCANRL